MWGSSSWWRYQISWASLCFNSRKVLLYSLQSSHVFMRIRTNKKIHDDNRFLRFYECPNTIFVCRLFVKLVLGMIVIVKYQRPSQATQHWLRVRLRLTPSLLNNPVSRLRTCLRHSLLSWSSVESYISQYSENITPSLHCIEIPSSTKRQI